MKNILLIASVFIVNLSFCQEVSNSLSKKIFSSDAEKSHLKLNTFDAFTIEKLSQLKTSNNSEGKFPFYRIKDQNLFKIDKTFYNKSIIKQVNSKKIIRKITDLVDKVIIKISQNKNIDIANFHNNKKESSYKKVNSRGKYVPNTNKLIVSYQLNRNSQLQIGNDIYSYINKIFKTKIDKTLLNSLNLFAIRI